MNSENFNNFLELCTENNIDFIYDPTKKIDLKFKIPGMERWARAKTIGYYYQTKWIKNRIQDYVNFKKNNDFILTKDNKIVIKSKYIDIKNKNDDNIALQKWADKKNVNTAVELHNKKEKLKQDITTSFSKRTAIVSKLDELQNNLEKCYEELDMINELQELRKVVKYYNNLDDNSAEKKEFYNNFKNDFNRYKVITATLKKKYPDKKIPSPKQLNERIISLKNERNAYNEQYKIENNKIKEYEKARKELEELLQKETAKITDKDINEKRKKNTPNL